MEFNKENHIAKMKKPVDKLVAQLFKQAISFDPNDGTLENVVFTYKGKQVKMSHHSFYRYSGIASVYKTGSSDNILIPVTVTDEMYLFDFIKPIIEILIEKA